MLQLQGLTPSHRPWPKPTQNGPKWSQNGPNTVQIVLRINCAGILETTLGVLGATPRKVQGGRKNARPKRQDPFVKGSSPKNRALAQCWCLDGPACFERQPKGVQQQYLTAYFKRRTSSISSSTKFKSPGLRHCATKNQKPSPSENQPQQKPWKVQMCIIRLCRTRIQF